MRFFWLILSSILALNVGGYARSITSEIPSYLEICRKAVQDDETFKTFRSIPEFLPIMECLHEKQFAEYLLKNALPNTIKTIEEFRKLDEYGNPLRKNVPGFGSFSGTTLRYIMIADQIQRLFNLPQNSKIAEIGGGFGGQCYILSRIQPFSKYMIYDLSAVRPLIKKVTDSLSVKNVELLDVDADLPEEEIDLLISNYAFCELDKETQLDYFKRVVKKADRGYMMFYQAWQFEALSTNEFVKILEDNEMNPQVLEEPILTGPTNKLVIWDKSKGK